MSNDRIAWLENGHEFNVGFDELLNYHGHGYPGGVAHGLKVKIHPDEIDAIGGTELAGALPAVSAEHLIAATDRGIAALAKGGTSAGLWHRRRAPAASSSPSLR